VGLALREFYVAYQNVPLVVEGATPEDAPIHPSAFNALLLALGVLFPYALYNALLTQSQSLRNFSHILGVLAVVFALRLRRANATGAILGRLRGIYGLVGLAYIGMLFCSFVLLRGVGKTLLRPLGVPI
jgi:hypothetical protein